jgi:predicted  nucleic acid-binding Zn-ribbon protein
MASADPGPPPDDVNLERVRCLECGEVYAKPAKGGAVERNPGCPACGYVGWIPLSGDPGASAQHRFGADRPRRPAGRWR